MPPETDPPRSKAPRRWLTVTALAILILLFLGLSRNYLFAAVLVYGDPPRRQWAIQQLSHGGPSNIPLLAIALEDDQVEVRQDVTRVLASFGNAAIPALLKALDDDDYLVRDQAGSALKKLGPDGADALVSAFQQPEEEFNELVKNIFRLSEPLQRRCASLLSDMDRAAPEALAGGLASPHISVRYWSLVTLDELDLDAARRALPAIAECGLDPDARLRERALDLLAKLDPDALTAIPLFIRALNDPGCPDPVIADLCQAIVRLGLKAKACAQALGERLLKAPTDQQWRLANGLVALGGEAHPALPALKQSLQANDPGLRRQAAKVLRSMGRQGCDALPLLKTAIAKEQADDLRDYLEETERRLRAYQSSGSRQ